MIFGGNATIYISDFERAFDFYTRILGLKALHRAGNDWALVEAGPGLNIGLHTPNHPGAPKPGSHGSISVGFNVSGDFAEVVGKLTEQGVKFRGPIVENPRLKLAFFGDPDGNDLYLVQHAQRKE